MRVCNIDKISCKNIKEFWIFETKKPRNPESLKPRNQESCETKKPRNFFFVKWGNPTHRSTYRLPPLHPGRCSASKEYGWSDMHEQRLSQDCAPIRGDSWNRTSNDRIAYRFWAEPKVKRHKKNAGKGQGCKCSSMPRRGVDQRHKRNQRESEWEQTVVSASSQTSGLTGPWTVCTSVYQPAPQA